MYSVIIHTYIWGVRLRNLRMKQSRAGGRKKNKRRIKQLLARGVRFSSDHFKEKTVFKWAKEPVGTYGKKENEGQKTKFSYLLLGIKRPLVYI